MSSKSIPKQRPSGGQPPSNQRQSMPDYQRQDRPYQNMRPNNTQGVHPVQSNSISQVNMLPQHAQAQAAPTIAGSQVMPPQNPMMRQYAAHQQPQNQQPLVPQPTMPVPGHSNAPQQMQQHVIRNAPPFQPFIPSARVPMPTHRQQFNPNHQHHRNNNAVPPQMANMQHGQPAGLYYMQMQPNPQLFIGAQHFPMPPAVNYQQPLLITDPNAMSYAQLQRGYQVAQSQMTPMTNNIQQSEMINTPQMYPQQPQQPKNESKKREKKMLQIFDEHGNQLNLSDLAKGSKSKPAAPKESEKTAPVETKNAVSADVVPETVNGVAAVEEAELKQSTADSPTVESPPAEVVVKSEAIVEPAPAIQEPSDSPQAVSLEEESANIQCDNETIESTVESESAVVEEATVDDKPDNVDAVDEIAAKVDEIALEEGTECADLGDAITSNEDLTPVHDNSPIVSETTATISGDMEVDVVKSVDESTIEPSKVEDSNDQQHSSSPQPSEPVSLPPDAKDEEDIESDAEPKLSRNSSQNGPKVYDKDFLLSLREHASDHAITISNPDNIRDIIKKNNSSKSSSHDSSVHNIFLPNFANSGRSSQNDSYRNKSQNQPVRRPSQPSKNYQDKGRNKIASTSLHREDMYVPNENAWRPGKVIAADPDEAETEALLKSVRAILNKLTPQNYHTLLEQFKKFKIDTKNRLTRVIDLIFDKAVKEPAFVVQYAGFCSELVHIKVTETNAKGEIVDVKFKNLLIEKCQETFFREMYSDIDNFNDRLKEIEECTDEKKKKELEEILDDDKRYSRRRSIGNIKLIAELYKLNMLNAKIMFACFHNLLKHNHEEYIECLCALITNIGANLSNAITRSKSNEQAESFESIFSQLKAIYDQKSQLKVSSRIRFTILDLLDLKKDNWVPRRKAEGPKTIAQVHEDMDKEARLKNLEISQLKRNKNMGPREPDEWQQVKSRKGSSISQQKLTINSINLLKESLQSSKPSIGSGSPFGMFAHGSHGGTNSNSQSRSSSSTYENKFHVLSGDKNPKSNSTFHDSLHAKDFRRDERKTSDVTNYYQSNRDGSLPNSRNSSMRSDAFEAKSHIEIDGLTFSSKTAELMKNYLKSLNYNDALSELVTFCSKRSFHTFISESIGSALEKHSPQRQSWGQLLGQLFASPVYDCSEIFEGLKALFATSEDMLIDLPKFWEFVAEIIANALFKVHESESPKSKDVFKSTAKAFGEVTGPGYMKLTDSLKDCLNKIVDKDAASEIISQLTSQPQSDAKTIPSIVDNIYRECMLSNHQITEFEKELPAGKTETKEIISALLQKCLQHHVSQTENAVTKNNLLSICRYCVKKPEDEVELLLACSDLFRTLNNPSNLLPELFNMFYKERLASKESIIQWQEKSRRTNSVAAASMERFIKQL